MNYLKAMWELQNVEIEMVRLRREWAQAKDLASRETGGDLASIQEGIQVARTRWEQIKEEYEESVSEIETIVRKLEQYNNQLYEDGAQSKELVSLGQNIDQLEKRRSLLEEKQLGYFETLDDLEKKIANETVRFQRLDEQRKSRLCRFNEVKELSKKDFLVLKSRREELRQSIPPAMMALYNDLVAQKKRPLALLAGENCSGCGIAQTVTNVNALKKGGRYIRCINCGRILIVSDDLEKE